MGTHFFQLVERWGLPGAGKKQLQEKIWQLPSLVEVQKLQADKERTTRDISMHLRRYFKSV